MLADLYRHRFVAGGNSGDVDIDLVQAGFDKACIIDLSVGAAEPADMLFAGGGDWVINCPSEFAGLVWLDPEAQSVMTSRT